MNAPVEFSPPPSTSQRLLAGLLRGTLRLLFRGLMRPPISVPIQRRVLNALTAATLAPRGVTRSAEIIAGVPCEWQRAGAAEGRALLYLHGGAYLVGSAATHRAITANLARLGAVDVCAADYRLAPEYRFPAPLEDALAVYQALLARGQDPARLAVAGDSAGGHLTLQLALALKERGLPLPAALVVFSPVTDVSCAQWHQPPAGDPLISRAWVESAIAQFCPPGVARDSAQLSPLFADLAGLPPLLIQVGEDEVLRNDSLRLAEAAQKRGVAVSLQRYRDCWHVFQAHAGLLRIADRALGEVAGFLGRHQGGER
ncbi:alpha/beta hydrolase [Pseudomonas citronellolis]|uniref:alpha/beta hydrolase n=1 Tax=Pseudomonas citronellolis TaxID=53408 RepID=UPI0023E40C41|nr:alpha/beta hydrolase [Pseudomonas citronellolis]MDF3932241.1 alpha/beta hydrolase [Pseudomonas citronellolis]